MEFPIELFFNIFGEYLLKEAFKQILNSRTSSSELARAIISHPKFKDISKEKLLSDEHYFRSVLLEVKSIYDDKQAIDKILKADQNITNIQNYILNNRFVRDQIQLTKLSNRQNFLILGHKQAGKTCFLYRLLYKLTQSQVMGILMAHEEILEKADRRERYELYNSYLKEIAEVNEKLNFGRVPEGTTKQIYSYIDMDFYELDWTVKLKFFDYAGGSLENIAEFDRLLNGEKIDGVIVAIDIYRLLAPYFRESAYQKELVSKEDHEGKYANLMNRDLQELTELCEGINLRLEFALSENKKNVPIAFVLTKFDGFENYDFAEAKVKELIYKELDNLFLKIIKKKRHPVSICLITSMGESGFARDKNGNLIFDNVYTGLPALLPKGKFPFVKYKNLLLPFLFLIQSHIQEKIQDAQMLFKKCLQELGVINRIRYNKRIQRTLDVLEKEFENWQAVTLKEDNFLLIPQGHPEPEKLLEAFFLNSK